MLSRAMLEEETLEADSCELCDSSLDDLFPEVERDTGPLVALSALDDALEERMTQPLPASRRTVQDPLLTSEQQYWAELAQYTRLPPEQEQALIERARAGDAQAREAILTSLLPNVSIFAWKYFLTYAWEVAHLDYLDVV
jgi:DNA-directed RNA polymerase sigma subunit (sigma70/sigma32)